MISKEAKEIADRIDEKIKLKGDKEMKEFKKLIVEVDFAHKYQLCPRCTKKLSFSFIKNFLSSMTIFDCKACKKSYKRGMGIGGQMYYPK